MRTRENIKETHPKKKSGAAPPSDFFPSSAGAQKITGEYATAVQMYSVTGLTDAELRRLANPNNPNPRTGAAWIPKPVRGKYHYELTLAGALQWLLAQRETTRLDHPVYASMEVADTIGLIPRGFQKWAQSQRTDFVNPNRTVRIEPLRRKAYEVLDKMFAKGKPSVSSIEGFEEWDRDTEQARKLFEERTKLEDEREVRHKLLVYSDQVEENIYEKRLGPARDAIMNTGKNLKREHRTLLAAANLPAETISHIEAKTTAAFDLMLQKMADIIAAKPTKPVTQT